jgi:hypothetical protein
VVIFEAIVLMGMLRFELINKHSLITKIIEKGLGTEKCNRTTGPEFIKVSMFSV